MQREAGSRSGQLRHDEVAAAPGDWPALPSDLGGRRNGVPGLGDRSDDLRASAVHTHLRRRSSAASRAGLGRTRVCRRVPRMGASTRTVHCLACVPPNASEVGGRDYSHHAVHRSYEHPTRTNGAVAQRVRVPKLQLARRRRRFARAPEGFAALGEVRRRGSPRRPHSIDSCQRRDFSDNQRTGVSPAVASSCLRTRVCSAMCSTR